MIKRVTTGTAVISALLLGFSTAHASKPLDVDCDVLEATLIAVDVVLDSPAGVQFPNLGQLVSQAKKDPVLFGTLSFLISTYSGGTINFTDPKEVVPTIAGCGQIPLLIELINN